MWMGSYIHTLTPPTKDSDEWIELYNSTNEPIDISDWKLTGVATGGLDLQLPNPSVINPKGYFLISNYALGDINTVLSVLPDWQTTAISLNNNCHEISLKNTSGETVDRMGCQGTNYFGGENAPTVKRSLERNYVVSDGTQAESWHTSVGFSGLLPSEQGYDFATPKQANDTSAPDTSSASVIDTNGTFSTDQDWTATSDFLSGSWEGFTDEQSSIDHYEVSYGTDQITPVAPWVNEGMATNATLQGLTLLENQTYYFFVRAYNSVGLYSKLTSDGITVNTTAPEAATDVLASDTPNDNGGSVTVSWKLSPSADVTEYAVGYRKSTTSDPYTYLPAGLNSTLAVEGLENDPQIYDFVVRAIDFSGLTTDSAPVTGSARDNLAPITV